MRSTLVDRRALAVAIIDPANGGTYNPASGGWEPFDPAKHLIRLVPVPNLPPKLSTFQTAMVADVLLSHPDCVALLIAVDAAGQPIEAVDVWPSPAPFAYPTFGGFSRS